MSSSKSWLKNIFVSQPDVAKKILDELLKVKVADGDSDTDDEDQEPKLCLANVLPLRLVCKDLKKFVDNYEKFWEGLDEDQPLLYPTLIGHVGIIQRLLAEGVDVNKRGAKKCWRSKY